MLIRVKSNPEMWEKERNGRKNNTVRDLKYEGDIIVVENSKTGEVFQKPITDITVWNNQLIISFKDFDNE